MKKYFFLNVIFTIILTLFCACSKPLAPSLGNVLVLGDSFSTFKGSIPEGYSAFYSEENCFGGVRTHEDTWWHQVIESSNSNLLLNSSYSGSTICHTGYDGNDYSAFSFVTRATQLIKNGFFQENRVDTVLIYGGLNDCWAQSPRGEIKYENITNTELYSFFPALSYLFQTIQNCSKNTRIIFIIEEQLDNAMKDGIKEIALHYSVETISPVGAELQGSHPTLKGMKTIAEQILSALSNTK